jgi:hypothetical protein
MIQEIIDKYGFFSDSTIVKFELINVDFRDIFKVEIKYAKIFKTSDYENIRLIFEQVISIRYVKHEKISNSVIMDALVKQENDIITFDFFPLMFGTDELIENKDSDFQVKCKKVSVTVL